MSETAIPFHQRLRRSTLAAHDRANHSPFMGALFDGRLQVADYARLVEQYWFVYQALEAAGDALAEDPVAGPFVTEELRRVPHLAQDIRFYGLTELTALPATQRYVDRLGEMAGWPGGFVAHHYTRFVGDLSGGPSIGRLMQRRFGFETNGIGFLLFGDIADPKAFKSVYREQLDAAPWDDDEKERVIAEVLVAYRFTTELFADLTRAKRSRVA